uniref:Cyclin N-terminal domain-containing protein n=1 Tax=Anas platyrhynchos TaxID=8839 RepID=A0A8B9TDM9_ANAPL
MEASAGGGAGGAAGRRWYFSREQLERSPSRRAGLDPDKELSYRQQAANLLQDMGQRLNVSQLTINTAIVYMHRFYMVQSFTQFHRNVSAGGGGSGGPWLCSCCQEGLGGSWGGSR